MNMQPVMNCIKTKYDKNSMLDRYILAPHDMANFLYYLEPKPNIFKN